MTCEAQSQQKDGTHADCKRDAVKGLEIDGKTLCKHHYAFGMLEKKLKEIGSLVIPENVEKKPKFDCSGVTKKGPCGNKIYEENGLCKSHEKAKAKKEAKEPSSDDGSKEDKSSKEPKPKCKGFTAKGDECKISAAEGCDGMCKKHFGKETENSIKDTPKTSDLSVDELLAEAKKKIAKTPKLPSRDELEKSSAVDNNINPMANVEIPFEIPA
jgi:hypothetical protein